ncbi:MAG: tetratricopeptide repeat protein [Planctomycetes bacterium]|nr:tetratricopeptide repeat protein [Planctomycetota bacterium]
MADGKSNMNLEKARAFFAKGKKVASNNNFDYGIEMFLEGLRCAPDALEDGHQELRKLSLVRQVKGGKKPSVVERMRILHGKREPIERMLMAEHLLAKDPDHLPYAEEFLKATIAGNFHKTARWIADLIFQANNGEAKPSLKTYLLLRDSYQTIGLYDRAMLACERAARLRPDDVELAIEFKNLSAELAVSKGKYDQNGDFRGSIKNREEQEKMHAQAGIVKTMDYRVTAVEDARRGLAKEPELPKNIFRLAKVLSELSNDSAENEAIELLEDAYERTSDFSYQQRGGEIRNKQIKRWIRLAKSAIEKDPQDKRVKKRLVNLGLELNKAETSHFGLCVENYPTDQKFKYEYGICMIRNQKYDEAIPLLQDAQKDPKRRISAMSKIGLCFFMKGWYSDSIEIYQRAIEASEIKDSAIVKELRYNLSRAYEQDGEQGKALELYRKIAQLDFSYKDVHKRIDKLRNHG